MSIPNKMNLERKPSQLFQIKNINVKQTIKNILNWSEYAFHALRYVS